MNLLWRGIAFAMARDKRLAQRYILQTFWFAVGLYMNFGRLTQSSVRTQQATRLFS